MEIKLVDKVGNYAENKDVARDVRRNYIMPALARDEDIVLDFSGVAGATQSFIHALISDPIRQYRETAFSNLCYKNANNSVKKIISVVYHYMQESLE